MCKFVIWEMIIHVRKTSYASYKFGYYHMILVDEKVIYSQESPNMVEVYRDFDWELDRFVEYRFPIKKPL